jgi:hypothetical protein
MAKSSINCVNHPHALEMRGLEFGNLKKNSFTFCVDFRLTCPACKSGESDADTFAFVAQTKAVARMRIVLQN